jgi:DNA ligase D-like protein (predicted ligase)
MITLLETLSPEEKEALEEGSLPERVSPMLAVLADESFSDPEWIFERKLDGERALCLSDGEEVRLMSRNGRDLSESYPELVEALQEMPLSTGAGDEASADEDSPCRVSWVGDGEVVAFDGDITSFSRLQARMQVSDPDEARKSSVAVFYYLFDLLHLAGQDLTALPTRTRKNLLRNLFDFTDPIRFTTHRNESGEAFHQEACRNGWEGIIGKKGDSPYVKSRSRSWLKFKCVARQELVIGGFTDPGGTRSGFGALLVGYYNDEGKLRYAGKVGTGFDEDTLQRLAGLFKRAQRKTSPFAREDLGDLPGDRVHWITPKFVGDFGFSEWTPSGKLRHPRFLGIRRDKDPEEVRRETPEPSPS